MLRYLYADQLKMHDRLSTTMFQDRAAQFQKRLGWDVTVDEAGAERDQYDDLNPLYVIWEDAHGRHGGSMRFLPTTGRVMVNDVFPHLNNGVKLVSPLIWDCTRFCLAPEAGPKIAAAVINTSTIRQRSLVIDTHHLRILQRLGLVRAGANFPQAYHATMPLIPAECGAMRIDHHHMLFKRLGQAICRPSHPHCKSCPLLDICAYGISRQSGRDPVIEAA